jgi:hypothetical protein
MTIMISMIITRITPKSKNTLTINSTIKRSAHRISTHTPIIVIVMQKLLVHVLIIANTHNNC